eukprot:1843448-Amphidinium_carterae.1
MRLARARGWAVAELRVLSDSCVQGLSDVVNRYVIEGEWPDSWLHSLVAIVPNGQSRALSIDSFPVLTDMRCITVPSPVYTAWASALTVSFLDSIAHVLPSSIIRAMAGKTVVEVCLFEAICAECSSMGVIEDTCGLTVDRSKYFDTIEREQVFYIARKLGMDMRVVQAWRSMVYGNMRHFNLGSALSAGFHATCGFGQGDPLSILAGLLCAMPVAVQRAQSVCLG